ncbi:MAG TPA: hypothetical protein VKX17_02235 [Planctomycetota bacterium]|nr:hypothetical protein [Planctomycetota bacterium]
MIIVSEDNKADGGHGDRNKGIPLSLALLAVLFIPNAHRAICGDANAEDAPVKTVFSSTNERYGFEVKRHRLQMKTSEKPPVLLSGEEDLFRDILTMQFIEIGPIMNYYQGTLKSRGQILTFRIIVGGNSEDQIFDDAVLFDETLYLIARFPGDQGYVLSVFNIDFKNKKVTPQKGASLDRQDRIKAYQDTGFMGSSGKLLIADNENVFIAIPERKPPGVILYKKVPSIIPNTPGKFERVDSVKKMTPENKENKGTDY